MNLAHGVPQELSTAWSFEVLPVTALVLGGAIFARGWQRLGPAASSSRAAAFCAALLALAAALVSPLDRLAATAFSAHMVQHLLLILVVPPLLIASRALSTSMLGLPVPVRSALRSVERSRAGLALQRAASSGLVVLSLHVVVLWAWHLPSLYEAALANETVHMIEHATFLGSAAAFWNLVLGRRALRQRKIARSMALVFGNLLQSGALGAILVFATSVIYPTHGDAVGVWGLTALEDQQLAGALMWIPPGGLYLVTIAGLFWRWLQALEIAHPGAIGVPEGSPDA